MNLKIAEHDKKNQEYDLKIAELYKNHAENHAELHKNHAKLYEDHTKLRVLTEGLCTKELVLCAGEIWKWAVAGDGGHLSDPKVYSLVLAAAKAMDMRFDIGRLKQLSQECIVARNEGAHFSTLKALEDSVLLCKKSIEMYPTLNETYPAQVKTISKYFELKRHLPKCFSDN